MIYHTKNTEDWQEVARQILATLPERDGATILTLRGTLGAGKTTCTQSIAQILGVLERVVSPTFVLMQIYTAHHTKFTQLVHIDAYRLEDAEEAEVLRLDRYLADPRTLIVVEWPENLYGLLPENVISINIEIDGEGRKITV